MINSLPKKLIVLGVLAAATGLAALPVAAITEDEAVALALEEQAGEVQEITLQEIDGQSMWEVHILDSDGMTTVFYFDAESGEPLDIEEGGSGSSN